MTIGTPWAELKADAYDPKFTIGTYNMPSSVLSDPSALTLLLSDNNVDVIGVQGLDKPSEKIISKSLKKIDRKFNADNLPSFLLSDFNGNDKENNYLSLNNFWTDTYVLQNAERDNVLSTVVLK